MNVVEGPVGRWDERDAHLPLWQQGIFVENGQGCDGCDVPFEHGQRAVHVRRHAPERLDLVCEPCAELTLEELQAFLARESALLAARPK